MALNTIPQPVATNPVRGVALPKGTGVGTAASSAVIAAGTFDAGVYQVNFSGNVSSVTLGNQIFSASGRTKKLLTSTTSSSVSISRNWVNGENGADGGNINSITYGESGGYATTSYGSTTSRAVVSTSTDLITWTTRTTIFGTTRYPRAVRFLNNIYVVVGDNGGIQTSTNGITWTTRTSNTTAQLNDVAYGAGVYVAGGSSSVIRSSTDAITWTTRTSNFGTTDEVISIIFANNIFVAVGTAGRVVTSTDGTTWTARTANVSTNTINQVAFGNSTYVLVAGGGFVRSSTDAVTWTTRDVSAIFASGAIQAAGFGNGYFFIASSSGSLGAVSTDGTTWTTQSYNNSVSLISASFTGGYYFLVGGNGTNTSRLLYSGSNSVFGSTTEDSGVTWNYSSELSYT
jgi:hypothetical protein